MEAFQIQIAGLTARVTPLFASTREYCRAYQTDREPECFIEVTENDLRYEQEMLDREAVEEGLRFRRFTPPFLERATIQRKIALELLNQDTLLIHGSTVGVDGRAYLITAPCGTGKSTHVRFWREIFGDRAVMINDDKTFLRVTPTGIIACGSPWSGKHGLDTNTSLPLQGICFLRRGSENLIRRADAQQYMEELLHQCFQPEETDGRAAVLRLVQALSQTVPLWEMECTKDPNAARISYRAMSNSGSLD